MLRFACHCAILSVFALSVVAYDDLTVLSDEFDSAHTITNWQRIYQVEGWGNNALQTLDINTTQPGRMTMVPQTSSSRVRGMARRADVQNGDRRLRDHHGCRAPQPRRHRSARLAVFTGGL